MAEESKFKLCLISNCECNSKGGEWREGCLCGCHMLQMDKKYGKGEWNLEHFMEVAKGEAIELAEKLGVFGKEGDTEYSVMIEGRTYKIDESLWKEIREEDVRDELRRASLHEGYASVVILPRLLYETKRLKADLERERATLSIQLKQSEPKATIGQIESMVLLDEGMEGKRDELSIKEIQFEAVKNLVAVLRGRREALISLLYARKREEARDETEQ